MKFLLSLWNTILFIIVVLFCSFIATFFLFIFLPEPVSQAIEYFLQIFNFSFAKPLTNAFFGCII